MKKLGLVRIGDITFKPTGRLAPKLSKFAHEAIERADEARAEISHKARYVIMGGNYNPEALDKRGYVPRHIPNPYNSRKGYEYSKQ
jgi:hypothetical protein